jgi:hypothetical protein
MSQHHEKYKKEQAHVMYNEDDPDLGGENAIRVELPSVESFFGKPWDEAIKEIDGYGMAPEDQTFDHYRNNKFFALPAKLKGIEEIIRRKRNLKAKDKLFPEDYFDEVESDPLFYKDEIEFIRTTNNRARRGYWCFINGTPTYIDGWHYTYLCYTPIDNDNRRDRLPDYRDVDRRIFIFFRWAYTTTWSKFKYVLTYRKGTSVRQKYFNNKATAAQFVRTEAIDSYILDDEGYYVDMGYRTVFGVVFPKRRRVGATFMGSHVGMRIAVDNSLGTFAIQALTEDTAIEDVYQKKILAPWRHYPWFLKPCASTADTNALVFTKKGSVTFSGDTVEHGGWIRPRSSANKAFDGNKLHAYLNDESGKKQSGNVFHEFTDTIRNSLAQGQNIHGFALYTSTFGEFESGGGKEYFELCVKSYSHKRNDNGITASGLVTLFVPAYDGYDGRVDMYGMSVIEDPEKPYMNLEGQLIDEGAKSTLKKTRAYYEEIKDWNSLNNEIRNNPWNLREAGRKANRSNYWDMGVLKGRISALKFGDKRTVSVNLEWVNGPWSSVRIVDGTPAKPGKWIISLRPIPEMTNKYMYDDRNQTYRPSPDVVGRYVLGCDPFSYDTKDVSGKKKSNGGGGMYMRNDPLVDGSDKDPLEHVTGDFVMTYNNRVDTTDEYCEDMLLAAVYCGAMVNTERNVSHVIKYFRDHHAEGYLMHMIDPTTGKIDPIPGVRTGPAVQEKIFAKFGDYVKNTGHRARHIELLEEIESAQSFSDMTDLDVFAACGMALLGAESAYPDMIKKDNTSSDFSGFIEMYD